MGSLAGPRGPCGLPELTINGRPRLVCGADTVVYGDAVGSFHGTRSSTTTTATATAAAASSKSFNGTKFFTWGANPQGNFWEGWLGSADEKAGLAPLGGKYIDLQTGVAPTQMQSFGFGPSEKLHWTEFIMAMAGSKQDTLLEPGHQGYRAAQAARGGGAVARLAFRDADGDGGRDGG